MTETEVSHRLLADYARSGSDGSFRTLVSRYINLVYSTALRLVNGDTHFAEDICQIVFTDLAHKAPTLPEDIKLAGWLHCHTCFVARKALRRERRRRARERVSVELQTIEDYTEQNVSHLRAALDEALTNLRAADRSAIRLRFFEQLDFRAIGRQLGSSEDAARMRVARALEKLGSLLRRRGVTVSIAGLSFILGTKTIHAAPVGLAANISAKALASVAKGSSLSILFKETCWTRLNVSILSAAAVIAVLMALSWGLRSDALPSQLPARSATIQLAESMEPDLGEETSPPEPPEDPVPPQTVAPRVEITSNQVLPTAAPPPKAPLPKPTIPATPTSISSRFPAKSAAISPIAWGSDWRTNREPQLAISRRGGPAMNQPLVLPSSPISVAAAMPHRSSGNATNAQAKLQVPGTTRMNGPSRQISEPQNVALGRVPSASGELAPAAGSASYVAVNRNGRSQVRPAPRMRTSSAQAPGKSRNRPGS